MLSEFRKIGFFGTFVVPACVLFLIPGISLAVMKWGEKKNDAFYVEALERGIGSDASLSAGEKSEAIEFFRANPTSKLLRSRDPRIQDFVKGIPAETKNEYLSFDIFSRIAWFCILSGAGLIAFVIASIPLSMRSQRLQYLTLATGWHSIRLFMTLQVIAQGILIVGLSFWITALVFHIYIVKLIGVAVFLTGGAMWAVLKGIFKRVPNNFEVTGKVLEREDQPEFWNAITQNCLRIGTELPDQIVVGIDDRFFVTEHPVMINGKRFDGKTLYLSLAMLKMFSEKETEAVLMHELAHFSGNDTYFSRKISPLLNRFNHYLVTLYEQGIVYPIFLCTLMFRNLFEFSLGKLSRDREFRADGIAAELVGGEHLAKALVRIAAYSTYRGKVETGLLDSSRLHDQIDVKGRLEEGYRSFVPQFAESGLIGEIQSSHPFDSHPSIDRRFAALGTEFSQESVRKLLAEPGDGKWHSLIRNVDRIEGELWSEYESKFREFHENLLALRYLPANEEEAAVVEKCFPAIELPTTPGRRFTIDHARIYLAEWSMPLEISRIAQISTQNDWGKPMLSFFDSSGQLLQKLPLPSDEASQKIVIGAIQQYVGRYHYAVAYQQEMKTSGGIAQENPDGDSQPS